MRRRCDTCGQTETLIRPVNGRDPYWLHLDNEQPHCEGRQEAPADSYSAGASSDA